MPQTRWADKHGDWRSGMTSINAAHRVHAARVAFVSAVILTSAMGHVAQSTLSPRTAPSVKPAPMSLRQDTEHDRKAPAIRSKARRLPILRAWKLMRSEHRRQCERIAAVRTRARRTPSTRMNAKTAAATIPGAASGTAMPKGAPAVQAVDERASSSSVASDEIGKHHPNRDRQGEHV